MVNIGSLPELPGPRLALGKDGTQLLTRVGAGPWSDQTANLANLQGILASVLDMSGARSSDQEFCLLFPRPVHLQGFFAEALSSGLAGTSGAGFSWSTDTTTGTDGTWTAYSNAGNTKVNGDSSSFRTLIGTVDVPGCTGLRCKFNGDGYGGTREFRTFHAYGTYASSGDRLAFFDPGSGLELDANYFNFGDLGHGTTSETRSFVVRNLSAAGTATNVQVGANPMPGAPFTDGNGNGLILSLDQASWYGSVGLGNLAPGADSARVYAKIKVPASLPPGAPRASELVASCDGIA